MKPLQSRWINGWWNFEDAYFPLYLLAAFGDKQTHISHNAYKRLDFFLRWYSPDRRLSLIQGHVAKNQLVNAWEHLLAAAAALDLLLKCRHSVQTWPRKVNSCQTTRIQVQSHWKHASVWSFIWIQAGWRLRGRRSITEHLPAQTSRSAPSVYVYCRPASISGPAADPAAVTNARGENF